MMVLTGSCLCGSVRYQSGAPIRSTICHCSSCRRASGSHALGLVTVARTGFTWTASNPAQYRSSAAVVRTFCGTCGTPWIGQTMSPRLTTHGCPKRLPGINRRIICVNTRRIARSAQQKSALPCELRLKALAFCLCVAIQSQRCCMNILQTCRHLRSVLFSIALADNGDALATFTCPCADSFTYPLAVDGGQHDERSNC